MKIKYKQEEEQPDPILPLGNASPYTVNGVSYQVLEDYKGYRERGIASWYGKKFHGNRTSNRPGMRTQ